MWKKDEADKPASFLDDVDDGGKPFAAGPPAVIGGSLTVEGTVTGKEDLLVDGRVQGDISLPENVVTVGSAGVVKARIHAAVIVIEGRVEGDLIGEEQIEIRRSGNVLGNIVAPRVGLEDGAQFKGNIDMSPKSKTSGKQAAKPADKPVDKPADKPAGKPADFTSNLEPRPDAQPAGPTPDSKLSG